MKAPVINAIAYLSIVWAKGFITQASGLIIL
jgi:hypothetical protein